MIFNYILVLIFIVSVAAFQWPKLKALLLFNPYKIQHNNEHWRWLSHVFVHGNWPHLLINLWVFYTFVSFVEQQFDNNLQYPKLFFLLFLVLAALASSVYDFAKNKNNPSYASLGASGIVSAVLFVFIMFAPTSPLQFIFLPGVNIPAFAIGAMYLLYEFKVRSKQDGIAHDAHLFGALFGIVASVFINNHVYSIFIESISAWVNNIF